MPFLAHSISRLPAMAALLATCVLNVGCITIAPVEPWQKATLGHETMKPVGPTPALARIDGHVYYSKEAVRGGSGIGGGGCGCN